MKQGSHYQKQRWRKFSVWQLCSRLSGQTKSGQKVHGRENSGDDSDAISDVSEQITQGEQLNIQLVRGITQLSKQTNKKNRTSFIWGGNTRKGNEILQYGTVVNGASQVVLVVKNPPLMQETKEMRVWSLGREDPLQEGMITHLVFLPGESHGQRRGGWPATVHGVAKGQTWLKQLRTQCTHSYE